MSLTTTSESKFLTLMNQIGKLLNSSGDLMRNMNTVLILLQEYIYLRNPCLLIRDSVINKYFIELAPEISDDDKNRWNQGIAVSPNSATLKFQHEMILYPEDPDVLDLPCSNEIKSGHAATIIQPVIYQQQYLPLCLLSVMVTEPDALNDTAHIVRFLADMLAISMIARGFPVSQIRDTLEEDSDAPIIIDDFVGQSEKLKKVADIIRKVATSKATVLICGESGTGKELLARAIHNHSLHRKAPYISVNCAALSENLLESELFGHERGAFTGAAGSRKGRFELADGGTLFLDEIGDTSLSFQTKILRVLQEGQFERLGGTKTIHVDVRIVCATNVNLEEAVRNGTFREDLYYRLNVVRLEVPPLRERREDIPPLTRYFLDQLNQQENSHIQILEEDLDFLTSLDWPGNVRELENTIHSAFLMQKNNVLNLAYKSKSHLFNKSEALDNKVQSAEPPDNDEVTVASEEIGAIAEALKRTRGVQVKAAEMLGISTRQLRYRIKKYNLMVRKIDPIHLPQ